MTKLSILFIGTILFLSSCGILQQTAKKELNEGFYTQKNDGKTQKTYIEIEDNSINIYPTILHNGIRKIDKNLQVQSFDKEMNIDFKQSTSFSKPSFDIDLITIPLKFRNAIKNVPPQLNANLNGALYLGYRNDKYILNYKVNPLGKSERLITHLGFSFGVFTGFGNTSMTSTNTNNILQNDYDGIVWSKGIAVFFALNNFTVGTTFGFDHLLDKNKSIWIYQSKPWLGLAFGLNLN